MSIRGKGWCVEASDAGQLHVQADDLFTPDELLDLAEELRQMAVGHGGPRTRERDLKRHSGATSVTVHDDGSWTATYAFDPGWSIKWTQAAVDALIGRGASGVGQATTDDPAGDIECARDVLSVLEPMEAGGLSSDERLFLRLARAVVRLAPAKEDPK